VLAVGVNAAALFAHAAPGERDLTQLRERIAELQRSLDEKSAERDEARDALRESERAISEANRTLAALTLEAKQLKAEAARLAERRRALERTLAERQGAVQAVLRARQGLAAPELVRAALSGNDPGQLARRLQYIAYLSRAAAELIATHRAELEALAALEREAAVKRARLAAVGEASRADRSRILREREARRRVAARLGKELRASRRQIGVLRADEGRLARLVEGLGRALARVELVPEQSLQTQAFSQLRGKLRLPVRGELTRRYGAPRGAGGVEAKGVFIRAPQGEPVRAVAGGQVVYADWMRGFGNLMIVDHGENYLSIYANADALLKQVGDVVRPGEPLATAGASGGNEETGLYFELRHLGRAFDPLGWVTLK